ncbi:MAG: hypothetical protein K0S11_1464 [Gammaproteobacteria bacterium]|jgi:hypothetical protein|nr:hypothetical protein [Gammaproteobacteria bacterium]
MAYNIEYRGFVADLTFNDYKAAYIAKAINCEDTILCGVYHLKSSKNP